MHAGMREECFNERFLIEEEMMRCRLKQRHLTHGMEIRSSALYFSGETNRLNRQRY